MLTWLVKILTNRVGKYLIPVLVVFLVASIIYTYGKKSANDQILVKEVKEYQETTKRIKDAVLVNRDATAARSWLRDFASE